MPGVTNSQIKSYIKSMKPYLIITLGVLCLVQNARSQELTDTLTLYFELGGATPTSASMTDLKSFRQDQLSSVRIVKLAGYTDRSGNLEQNDALAKKRIDQVADLLGIQSYDAQVLGERPAEAAINYVADTYRKVEVIFIPNRIEKEVEPLKERIEPAVEEPVKSSMTDKVDEFLKETENSALNIDLTILFEPGEATMLPSSEPEINELLKIMKEHPELNIHIHGHVCCNDDQKLSQKRAMTVYNFLAINKISTNRMKVTGHSNTMPKVYPERSENDRIANRRVTIEFMK